MRIVKVLVHVADWEATDNERQTLKCEVVARFGVGHEEFQAYDYLKDEEVTLCLKFKDWWDNSDVNKVFINNNRLRIALERINMFPL